MPSEGQELCSQQGLLPSAGGCGPAVSLGLLQLPAWFVKNKSIAAAKANLESEASERLAERPGKPLLSSQVCAVCWSRLACLLLWLYWSIYSWEDACPLLEEGRKCQKGQNEEKEYGTIVNCYWWICSLSTRRSRCLFWQCHCEILGRSFYFISGRSTQC